MEMFHPVSQLPSTLEGDSLWLRSPNGEPFITVYEVVADVVQSKGVFDVTDTSLSKPNSTSSDE